MLRKAFGTLPTLFTASLLAASPVFADPPKVVTDIPPVHGLTAAIMGDLGTPEVLLRGSGSPHDLSLRPSDAARLQDADLVIWVGPLLTPQLEKVLGTLTAGKVMALLDPQMDGVLQMRDGADFKTGDAHHDHADDMDHDDHDDHAKHDEDGEQGDHDDHANHDDHGGDGKHDDHDDHGDHEESHGHAHAHGDGPDPHAWLSPEIAAIWAERIAETLTSLDPENAEQYASNLADVIHDISTAASEARDNVAGHEGILVMHDSTQYFERAMGVETRGAISDGHDARPGAERLAELRDLVAAGKVTCVLVETGASAKPVRAIDPDGHLQVVDIDPLGLTLEPGPSLYPDLLRGLAEAWARCP